MLIISSMKVGALTQTASALASGDTEIHSANSMANRGSATSVTVGGDEPAGTGKNKAALIRFSLPTLPAGATITDTKLRLDVTESSTNTFRVFVMKKPWVEGAATWSMYNTAGVWDLAGGRGATDRESPAIARITPRATGVQDFYLGAAFDQQVGDWMSGEEDNDGIELIAAEAMDGFSFSTREVATASQRPQLIITYDDGIVADTTPPETTITSGPAEGETLTVDPATFGFSSSETGSTFECSLDGGAFGACTSPKSYAALSDGSHTLQVKATDAAGNTDLTPASRTWTVDATAPSVATVVPRGGATDVAATSNVEATFSEAMDSSTINGSTFTLTEQNASQPLTARVSYDSANKKATLDPSVDLEAGTTYTATVRGGATGVKDLAGNPLGADNTWSFTTTAVPVPLLDLTAPETTIGSGPSGTVSTSSASFAFSSDEAGSSFECSLDGGAFGACTSPKSYAALSDGSHTLQVKATDAAGNTDLTPTSRTWTVDTTAPDTAIDSGPSGTLTVAGATFTFSSSESSPEAGAAFRCRLDGAAYSACTPPKSYTNLPNGSHTFDVRARDGAGNLDATPASMTFSVEVPPPPDPGTLRAERSLDHMYTKYQTDAELDFWLDKLAATGAETVQTAGAWDHFEPSADDSYSWAFMDKFIAHAEARGLKVRMQVSATPDWVHPYLASQGIAQSDRVWYPPRGSGEIALYQDFWHDLVARYGTRVASYEVWNEPNHDSFFEPKANVSEYAAMQRAAYLGAKSANPNVQIVCCALSGNDMGYLDQLYTALRAYPEASANDDFFDALGVHPYAYENSKPLAPAETRNNFLSTFGPADATFVGIDKMIADLDAHGDSHKKVWIGEFGYRMTSGGYHEPISDDLRAQYLKQAYALLDQRPRVMGMAWYSYYRDPSWALVNKSTRVESVSFDAFRQAAVRN